MNDNRKNKGWGLISFSYFWCFYSSFNEKIELLLLIYFFTLICIWSIEKGWVTGDMLNADMWNTCGWSLKQTVAICYIKRWIYKLEIIFNFLHVRVSSFMLNVYESDYLAGNICWRINHSIVQCHMFPVRLPTTDCHPIGWYSACQLLTTEEGD